ncbi:MAG TPA: response regulator [Pyrinomonadaceae bacterium]
MSAILVADNDPHWLNVMCGLLAPAQHTLIRATSPSEALAALSEQRVDLAVLDLRLKDNANDYDISGFKVAKDSDHSIPKIIVSHFKSEREFADAYPAAFKMDENARPIIVDYVQKGELETKLLPSVQNALKIKVTWSSASQSKIAQLLHGDYETARWDAKMHYLISSAISVIFALIFFWGAYRLHSANEHSATPLILLIIGVFVAEITNYLFGRKLEFLHHRVERYHDELLQTERFGQLLAMADSISDEKAREVYKFELFMAATSEWIGKDKRSQRSGTSTQPLDDENPTRILHKRN